MSLYRRGETWWADIVVKGRRARLSLNTTDRKAAQRAHDELKASYWNQTKSGATLIDALVLWLKASPRSRNEKNAIAAFLKVYPSRPLSQVTDIAEALSDKSPSHYNRIANIIRAAINLAHKSGLHDKPAKITRKRPPKGRLEWFTQDEWGLFDATLDKWPHAQAMARFGVFTGLRWSNVANLCWREVDMSRKLAWVHGDESKSGKPIAVPLSDLAMEVLNGQIGKHDEFVFVWRGHPVKSIKTVWNQAREETGLKWATFHTLRHTWASWHVQAGTPMAVLKELGGWHSMDMVMRYSHLAPEHLEKWVNYGTKRDTVGNLKAKNKANNVKA